MRKLKMSTYHNCVSVLRSLRSPNYTYIIHPIAGQLAEWGDTFIHEINKLENENDRLRDEIDLLGGSIDE